jgi:23S rRNA (cytosine1962-C5)-methyltransferase
MARPSPTLPHVVVTSHGADKLRAGLPWVYRKDVVTGPGPEDRPPEPTPYVDVVDRRRNAVARALWCERGTIALRRWGSPGAPVGAEEVRRRVDHAVGLRRVLVESPGAHRLCHGEADDLPGLFVDRYGDALVVQTGAHATELLLPEVLEALQEVCRPSLVVRRDDGSTRDLESLPRVAAVVRGGPETLVAYREGALRLEVDLLRGHKTGAYLDQRDNHLLAGRLGAARALDLFSAEGGFGLQVARGAKRVLCVEQDPRSAERLTRNAALNGLQGRVDCACGNAFDLARELCDRAERFDLVVVDPPALAKRAGPLETALRGYFELNRRALRLVADGGWVMTFSCSGRVTGPILEDVVREAAAHSHRRAQVVTRLHAGPDHPGLLGLPETEYLKGLLLRVL